jgi:hypothetical protein
MYDVYVGGKRTHSVVREHILWQEDTFCGKRTQPRASAARQPVYTQHIMYMYFAGERILQQENTFYSKITRPIAREHIL